MTLKEIQRMHDKLREEEASMTNPYDECTQEGIRPKEPNINQEMAILLLKQSELFNSLNRILIKVLDERQ